MILTPEGLKAEKLAHAKTVLEQAMALQAAVDDFTTRLGARIDSEDDNGAASVARWMPSLSQWTNRINEARGALWALDKVTL